MTTKILLNCDMGESFGNWKMGDDESVMEWVDMANIACGFHASDPHVMSKTIKLAEHYHTQIGAHPGYQDLVGFGRRSIPHTMDEISELVCYQVGALQALCRYHHATVGYVKPHGALYNDMMANTDVFNAVAQAVAEFNIPLMILSSSDNQQYLDIADDHDLPLLFEAFADRAYLNSGQLAPRTLKGSVYVNQDDIYNQVMQIVNYGSVTTLEGERLPIEADTICVHGDNPQSIALIKKIRQDLNAFN
ncbi:5-oxoprolinase subunit PxpA [Vibrio lentus]|uniref:5-oxoprolinase (ATP-hydrolyzing) subunit A n=1 Tax=Vibrio lentus TaxID=136468 RepID=A0AA44VVB8_9VIBR|nr:5-oxoprolinase subunit PxpA [Vibrio lentus]MCB5361528.1 LamB/YcsF family protein [Vibrio lentus]MCB5451218.1 LamB/YcsF family protein [Vibrio lentus]MCB5463264.1 LamB/YcsF family protein [Vibrio lentus]MCC4795770.1 LamB/YcsF family protein [Vibrio lentus]MCC4852072.1 LamB/YcsF family protein [Vibrio lentus]